MPFSKDVYKRAFEEKRKAQHNAFVLYERKKEEIYSAVPRLSEIDRLLGANGVKAAMAAVGGDAKSAQELQKECEALQKEKEALLIGVLSEDEQYDCPICKDTGYSGGVPCDCVERTAKQIALSDLSSETPVKQCNFDNFSLEYYQNGSGAQSPCKRMTQILKICKEFAENFSNGNSLLLLGGTGLGKTHLSLSIAERAVNGGHSVIYGSAQNIMNSAAAEQFSYSGKTDYIDSLLTCDLLIIDDLGTEMQTQFTTSCIYNIVNTRILRGLSTVINTNLTLPEIEERYTPRVLSRLIEKYTALSFLGEDIRQQKAMNAIKNK